MAEKGLGDEVAGVKNEADVAAANEAHLLDSPVDAEKHGNGSVVEPEEHYDDYTDPEKQREAARYANPNGYSASSPTGVDVARAEKEFAELNRQISNFSQASKAKDLQRRISRGAVSQADLEKATSSTDDAEDDEPFDLESTLRNSKALEDETGIKSKHIGVMWEGLTVRGLGGVRNYVKTFPMAFVSFFNIVGTIMHLFGWGKKGREFEILKNQRGVAKPGEMVLVLGRPGSGCTTFLKIMSNQRFGYTQVNGEVNYGPFDAQTFAKRYRGEAVYNMEDDEHHPTLTVQQTLGFALDCKMPGKRPGGMSTEQFEQRVIELLLRMFNIQHTRNTIVGNPQVRGISGGERKRVSIAEMMITGASCVCYDNSSRGLDASTATDYAKSLRVLTNIYKTTTFVSLYQASEVIYSQFDRVIVIDAGRQVFNGPTTEARKYFEDLGYKPRPRQTTPDYLTGCTDPYEREPADDKTTADTPNTPEELAQAFEDSKFARRLDDEMNDYRKVVEVEKQVYEDFQTAVRDGKRRARNSSVYTVPFYHQVWNLMKRQFFLKWQDKFSLCVSWATSLTVAVLLATVWVDLPQTSAGAFTRGGVLFIALLFNAFQAFGELASTMLGRRLVNKHRAYTFHRPSALWIAQIIVDMSFASVKIIVFSLIVYFSCGLARTPGAFFTFVLVIFCGYLALALFFRTIGCVCPDFDYAIKFAATVITLFVITSGYLIQYDAEQKWLSWIFYINPVGLGFSSLMVNEFNRINLTCISSSLIPFGPGYNDLAHQVCTLRGSVRGDPIVKGIDYVEQSFSYFPADKWRNFGILIALIVVFLLCNVWGGEYFNFGAGGRTVTFFAREDKDLKKYNEELEEKKQARLQKKHFDPRDVRIESNAVLTWEDLRYDVPVPSGTLRLLDSVYGYVRPGEITALMGASGAGKTTLLDVLASRKNVGVISGEKLIDGRAPGTSFQRGTSYAEQLDVHEATQTVREALRFSADLRQPYNIPQEEKYAYVEEILSLLEMEDIADAIIGSPDNGLAVEQRKRVTIGVELAAKPELLLFLDEPTSGLDSQSAFNIVRFLKKLAAANQAILCTIHQPNSALFENFDRLLLLQKGGQCVYFGEIGQDAHVLRDYFHRNGADCPAKANPAEWMLDAIGAGQQRRIGDRDWADIWRDSDEFEATKADIIRIKDERRRLVDAAPPVEHPDAEYATPLWHQIRVVNWRQQLSFWRSPNYGFTRLFNHVVIALVAGLAYLQLDESRASLQYRVFAIFQVTVLPALILAQVQPKYAMARVIFYRESAAKAYRQLPFALSMVLAEMPYSILCAVGFFLPLYYIPGFNGASSRAGLQFFFILITELFSVTLGQAIAAITPDPFISSLVNPFVIITFSLFCGVTIPAPLIPSFWRSWLYQLDPFTRLVGGMIVTELHELPVVCTSSELNRFTAPSGTTCGAYMKDFFARGGPGYLVNNATSACEYCAYTVGDQFYQPFGLDWDHRWRDLGILAAFIGSNLIILFLGSRYFNFYRR